jgi:limonene 1,2-monooxygenase
VYNEYTVGTLMRLGRSFKTPDEHATAFADMAAAVIGTPDDLVAAVRKIVELTQGFGTVIGFVHDWANRQDTFKSWELVARYVVPEVNGLLASYRESQRHVIEHRESFERAGAAVMTKIMENERAAEALRQGSQGQAAMPAHHAPTSAPSRSV